MFTWRGNTCEYDGIKSTSSNVKPSPKNFLLRSDRREDLFSVAMCKDRAAGKYVPNDFFRCK